MIATSRNPTAMFFPSARALARGLLALVIAATSANRAVAQEPADSEEPEYWPNHFSASVAGTSALDEEQTDLTLGVEYGYRLNERFSIGALAEFVLGGEQRREAVFGVPISFHAVAGLRLVAAPLAELINPFGESEFNVGLRLGADYEFELGRWSVAPLFFADFVDDETLLIYGIAGGIFF